MESNPKAFDKTDQRSSSGVDGDQLLRKYLANISDWPEAKIDSLRRVLAGETLAPLGAEPFEIARALAPGSTASFAKISTPLAE